MVVCKFFQQGYCRFGQSCRFEHIYGSKYSYHASSTPGPTQPVQNKNPGAVTDEQLVAQVEADIKAALNGGQWLLSCYAPFKKHSFPGLNDLCPEEARLFIYEAKANNKLEEAIAYLNSLSQDSRQKYEQLAQPNQSTVRTLRSLYNGEAPQTPFASSTTTAAGSATSIFHSANQSTPSIFNQNTAQSIFAQQASKVDTAAKSIFAQATQNAFTNQAPMQQGNSIFAPSQAAGPFAPPAANSQNVFAQNTAAKSIFAQANQSNFAQSSQSSNTAQSVFANATRQALASDPFRQQNTNSPTDLFRQQTGSNDLFKQQASTTDPFGKPSSPFSNPQNIFQTANAAQPSNAFGGNVFAPQTNVNDPVIYSKEEELSENDLEAFNSTSFKLGFVPEIAPLRSLCF